MIHSSQSILFRKVSTLFSLMVLMILAAVVGVIIIHKAQKLAELQKPLPSYISQKIIKTKLIKCF
jgi:hypothetical protein